MDKVVKIRINWDEQESDNEGWYVECLNDEGMCIVDSEKVWFPVDVDDFGKDQLDELVEALHAQWPDAEVVR